MTFLPPSDYGQLQDRWCLIHLGFQVFSTGPFDQYIFKSVRKWAGEQGSGEEVGLNHGIKTEESHEVYQDYVPSEWIRDTQNTKWRWAPSPQHPQASGQSFIDKLWRQNIYKRPVLLCYYLQVLNALRTETSAWPRGGISSRPADYAVTKQKRNDKKKIFF